MCRRRGGHRKVETSNQASEALVVHQGFTDELLGSTTAAIVDELLEKDWAKPLSLDVGAHDDGEFGGSVVRVRDCTRYSESLDPPAFALAGSDECHSPIVVDLRQTRELGALQLAYAHEDSIANIVRVDLARRTVWVHADEAKGCEAIGVSLNDEALAVLHAEMGKHPERVFTFRGRPLVQANTRSWRNALKRAAIETFVWHHLRNVLGYVVSNGWRHDR